jgi:hypothetical protein
VVIPAQMQFIGTESYRHMADARRRGSFPYGSESRQPPRDHLESLRRLGVAAVFVVCALQPPHAEARAPSTRACWPRVMQVGLITAPIRNFGQVSSSQSLGGCPRAGGLALCCKRCTAGPDMRVGLLLVRHA